MKKLTARQQTILDFISLFYDEHGFTPTIREIAANYNITAKGAYDHISALKAKGKITSEKGRLRTIQIVKSDEPQKKSFVEVPIFGDVMAENGMSSEENNHRFIPVHASLLKQNEQYFAIKVQGDSMSGIGIIDGDTAVIEKQETACNGDLIAALIEERYVLKRYYKQIDNIKLCSENPEYHPIYTDDIKILGHLVCVFRFY